MSMISAKKRIIENEVVFRQFNEQIQKGFDEIQRLAEEEGHSSYAKGDDRPLFFYCECSDENCQQRIKLQPSRYADIHQNRRQFIIVCGHESKLVESVVERQEDYCVVEKIEQPPEKASKLHKTDVDNT